MDIKDLEITGFGCVESSSGPCYLRLPGSLRVPPSSSLAPVAAAQAPTCVRRTEGSKQHKCRAGTQTQSDSLSVGVSELLR